MSKIIVGYKETYYCSGTYTDVESSGSGAVIRVEPSGYLKSSADFISCSAGGDGGAVLIDNGSAEFSYTQCTNNSAGYDGGAIAAMDSGITIKDSTFTGNYAAWNGGAIAVGSSYYGYISLQNVTFNGNSCGSSGGAVYCGPKTDLYILGSVTLATSSDTIVLSNSSEIIWWLSNTNDYQKNYNYNYSISDWSLVSGYKDCQLYVMDNQIAGTYTLAQNVTDSFSAILNLSYKDVNMTVSTVAPTQDYYGYNLRKFTLQLVDNTVSLRVVDFERTVVSVAAFPTEGKAEYVDGTISNQDNPTLDGGAFYVESNGTLTVSDATFRANHGKLGGAIYVAAEGKANLSDVVFTENTSSGEFQSGAVYNAGTTTLTGSVTLTSDTDMIYNYGDLVWNITDDANGYVSDFAKINIDNGNLVITGFDTAKYGTYKLADNAVNLGSLQFIVRGDAGDETITVNGAAVVYDTLHAGKLYTGDDNALYLQLGAVRQVVNETNFPGGLELKDGLHIDLTGSEAYDGKGGVFYVESDGVLTNAGTAEFIGCSSTGNGSVIYNDHGTVDLSDVTFKNNRGNGYWGGALTNYVGTLTLSNADFDGNSVGGNGGAIYTETGTATITGSTFSNNRASSGSGGAIFNDHSGVLTVRDTEFSGNSAINGGAIMNTNSATLTLDNVTFNGNTSTSSGSGAVFVGGDATVKLEGAVTLATNTDTIKLGADANMTWVVNGDKTGSVSDYSLITGTKNAHTLTIDASAADSGKSYVLAGNAWKSINQQFTIAMKDATSATITVNGDSVTDSNHVSYRLATDDDGQLVLSLTTRTVISDTLTVKDGGRIDLTGISAYDGNGGGAYVVSTGTLASNDASGATAVNCSATGNGGFAMSVGTVDMDGVILTGNKAMTSGGAFYSMGTFSITNSTFKGNSASGNGGAVYLAGNNNTLSGSFVQNKATGNGGAVYVAENATLNLSDASFQDNTAALGGAIYNKGSINLTGTIELAYDTDTVYNAGSINWDLASDADTTVSGYQYIESNVGTLAITVSSEMPVEASYEIATGDFTGTFATNFTLTGATGTASISVGGDTVEYNDRRYTLSVTDSALTLTSTAIPTGHAVNSDIDGNGISDVLFQWDGGNSQLGFWMNGTNDWKADGIGMDAIWSPVKVKDMNSDGQADVIMVGSSDGGATVTVGYYDYSDSEFSGTTLTKEWVTIGSSSNLDDWEVTVGNMTGNDGKNSIVFRQKSTGAMGVWKDGDSKSGWEGIVSPGTVEGQTWSLVGTGDFDGDGKESAVLIDNNGTVELSELGASETQNVCSFGSGWNFAAVGDFSNDGKDDIILFNDEYGLMVKINDGDGTNWENIGQLDAQDWFIVGAGDYNGDQKDDLLVRQYSTGMLGYYESANQAQWVEMGRGVDMDWTVIA